jgi:hypothetical protein
MPLTKSTSTSVGTTFTNHFRFLGSNGLVGTWAGGPFSNDLDHRALIPESNITFADDLAGQKVVIGYDGTPEIGLALLQDNVLLIAEVTTVSGEITVVDDKRTPAVQRLQAEINEAGPNMSAVFQGGVQGSFTTRSEVLLNLFVPEGSAAIVFTVVESIKTGTRFLDSVKIDAEAELLLSDYHITTEDTSGFSNGSNMRIRNFYIPESSGMLTGDLVIELVFAGSGNGSYIIMYAAGNDMAQGNTPNDYLTRKFSVNAAFSASPTDHVIVDAVAEGLWGAGEGLQANEGLWWTWSAAALGGVNPTPILDWLEQPVGVNARGENAAVNVLSRCNCVNWHGEGRGVSIIGDEILVFPGFTGDRTNVTQGFILPPSVS